MQVTLLNPVPAIVAAAISIPVLLLLYFLKLRRRPVRVSSTLLWEQATRDLQVNVPFRLIRPTWLLLLQLLILSLFLLALARPAVNMEQGTPERVVLLIDRSASMNALDGAPGGGAAPATRLAEAKARALRMVEELTRTASGSSFAVIEVAAEPRVLASFTVDRGAVRGAIEGVAPTDQPGDLAGALRLAAAMLSGEVSEAARARPGLVMLFSDGSFAPPPEGYALAGAEFRYHRVGAPAAPSGEVSGHDNLGIVALAARRDWTDPAVVRIFARLHNAGANAVAAPLVLSIGGEEVDRIGVDVPGAGAGDELPQSTATLSLTRREGGVVSVSLARADLLDADNAASMVLEPATRPRVLLVTPDAPPEAPPEGASAPPARPHHWIISNIIEEMRLPMRQMTASLYEREMTSDTPPEFDLVIFDRVRPSRLPASPTISFGAGLPWLEAAAPPADSPGTYFLSWQRTHPLLRHVALDTIYVTRPMVLRPGERAPPISEVARGNTGPLIVVADDAGTRRVVVGFEPAQSTWPLHFGFPIFLAQAVDHLTLRADDRAGRFFTTGEPVEVLVAPGTGRVTLSGPQRLERSVGEGTPVPPGLSRVSLGLLERAGVYRVEGVAPADGARSPTSDVSLNLLDEVESSLTIADTLRVGGQMVAGTGAAEEPLELWPFLIAAAFVLLTIEWFINAWSMKV